jgi:hypothetical protein
MEGDRHAATHAIQAGSVGDGLDSTRQPREAHAARLAGLSSVYVLVEAGGTDFVGPEPVALEVASC